MGAQSQIESLQFGRSQGQANSLWLTRGEEKPDQGVLVAASASLAWLAPQHRAIAYLTDGALFVREIVR